MTLGAEEKMLSFVIGLSVTAVDGRTEITGHWSGTAFSIRTFGDLN